MEQNEKNSTLPDTPEDRPAGLVILERDIDVFDNPFDFELNFCRGCDREGECDDGACMTMG